MEIIKMEGAVLLTKRKWWQLYKRGWHKHNDLWGGLWWIRFKWSQEEQFQEQDKNKYSEEELKSAFKIGFNIGYGSTVQELDLKNEHCDKWFEQFKNK